MTTTPRPSRRPLLLLASTAVLAVAGVVLLTGPPGHKPPVAAAVPQASTRPSPAELDPPSGSRSTATAPSARPTTRLPAARASALPPRGEGPAGDQAIQRSLEAAWPADLPAADEQELLRAGRALLRADATGRGRARWPTVFPGAGQTSARAFGTAGFRIQAAIARRDGAGGPGRAVVHLVWAGIDNGGTHLEGRITDWHFTRTRKGAPWAPTPNS
ncbi:hypothetical protein [Streptomyces sp. NPDC093094]|uniref:hypothetical protein n=1 Tax=Streptomyces sp. NPDC093094 TaxID=3366026 RepID=UPI0037F356AE